MNKVLLLPSKKLFVSLPGETIYQLLRRHRIPIGSSCDGEGVCDKCRVRIVDGGAHLPGKNETEERLIREHGFDDDERVACQTVIEGDITITTGYW